MKILVFFVLIFINLFANESNLIKQKFDSNEDFKILVAELKNIIVTKGFTLSYESDIALTSQNVATALEKTSLMKNGVKIGFCKASLTLEFMNENIDNIVFCPLSIALYESDKGKFISYLKNSPLNENEKTINTINNMVEDIIKEFKEDMD